MLPKGNPDSGNGIASDGPSSAAGIRTLFDSNSRRGRYTVVPARTPAMYQCID